MKPIPAIDERGEFVEATLRSGDKVVLLSLSPSCIRGLIHDGSTEKDICWFPLGNYHYTALECSEDIIDLPAVRERVERARAKRVSDQVIRDLADSGRAFVRIDPSAVLTHTTAPAPPRKPSFAEALEREIANDLSRVDRNPNRSVTPAMLYDWLLSARAASGE